MWDSFSRMIFLAVIVYLSMPCVVSTEWLKFLLPINICIYVYVFYEAWIIAQSDAEGAFIWLGAIPLFVGFSLAIIVSTWRLSENGRYRYIKLVSAFLFSSFGFLSIAIEPCYQWSKKATGAIFHFVHGKTPWEAGHGR